MSYNGILNFLKPYANTFINRMISGMGMGMGMGIAWNFQSNGKK